MKRQIIVLALLCTPALAQQPSMGQQQMPDLEEMFFKQFDLNQDGQVSKAEFLKPTEAQFEHMDRDKNGTLNRIEVKAFNDEMNQRMQEMQRQMQQQGGMQRQMPQQGGMQHQMPQQGGMQRQMPPGYMQQR